MIYRESKLLKLNCSGNLVGWQVFSLLSQDVLLYALVSNKDGVGGISMHCGYEAEGK